MPSSFAPNIRRSFGVLVCALAFLSAGCHRNNLNSGYGVAWVTMTSEPAPEFSSYNVYLYGVVLTRTDGALVTAYPSSYYEKMDLTKTIDLAEMLGSYTGVATGTYTAATIILDYTSAQVTTLVGGVPTLAKVVDSTGVAVTQQTISITFDPANPLVLNPTYATTAASRLAIDVDLAASTKAIDTTTSPVTVTVKPFVTMSVSAADQRLIRVRGPLINSSIGESSFTVYVRPFYDQADAIGLLTVFNDANTVYNYNGKNYVGAPGMSAVSQSSSGTTILAAYTTYEPTATPSAAAGIFHGVYMVGGSTFQDNYTYGIDGTVIARNGNVLTVRGGTVSVNDGSISTSSTFCAAGSTGSTVTCTAPDALVTVGPATAVTQDGSATTGLTYASIGVGQHIAARGDYTATTVTPNGTTLTQANIDSTSASGATTGSVRILAEQVSGQVISSSTDSLLASLQYIDFWPASVFAFAGTDPAAFDIGPAVAGAIPTTGLAAGDPVLATGYIPGFGVAPPDFAATSVAVDTAIPASISVSWGATGTTTPFAPLSAAGFSINTGYTSGAIRVGSQSIDLATLGATLQIVPLPLQSTATTLTSPTTPAPAYNPLFSIGNGTAGIFCFSVFDTFLTKLNGTLAAATPVTQFTARGVWDRTTNIFTATTVNVVL